MTFDITDHGACAAGRTLCTTAIQKAIDACTAAGGGIVVCPPGTYLTGSVVLKDNVELYLAPGCKILGSPDMNDYKPLISPGFRHESAPEGTSDYLIGAAHARHIAITGPGEINANGVTFYSGQMNPQGNKFAEKPTRRPRLLMLHKCTDVRLEGPAFVDSPCWTMWLMMCERVTIHRIRITGDQRMINNDGIDIDACRNVTVSDCRIKTDDDCIVVRAIQRLYDEPAISEMITVTNCTLESTCQCIRISCPSDNVTRNCVFSNLILKSNNNGINFDFPSRYLAAGSSGGADVSEMSFANIIIDCQRHPVRIEVQAGIRLKQIRGISFSGLRTTSLAPIRIVGSEETVIEDISFSDATIRNSAEQAFVCANSRRIRFNNVAFSNSRELHTTAD